MESLEELMKAVNNGSAADFELCCPHPVLIIESHAGQEDNDSFQTVINTYGRKSPAELPLASSTDTLGVLPIQKKAGGKFPNMISVGRTDANDVVVDNASVSKFHAYFLRKGESSWFVQDANSSNGTYLDGQKIPTDSPSRLSEGATVQFSTDTRFRFYSPRGLYEYLRASK